MSAEEVSYKETLSLPQTSFPMRGDLVSRPIGEVMDEAEGLVRSGVRELLVISQDTSAYGVDLKYRTDFWQGRPLATRLTTLARELAASLGDRKALIHQHHGVLTVGETVDEAAWWFMALERACQVQLIAEAAGDVTEVPAEYARFTYDQSGFALAGWFQFQPHWEDLLATDGEAFLGSDRT